MEINFILKNEAAINYPNLNYATENKLWILRNLDHSLK